MIPVLYCAPRSWWCVHQVKLKTFVGTALSTKAKFRPEKLIAGQPSLWQPAVPAAVAACHGIHGAHRALPAGLPHPAGRDAQRSNDLLRLLPKLKSVASKKLELASWQRVLGHQDRYIQVTCRPLSSVAVPAQSCGWGLVGASNRPRRRLWNWNVHSRSGFSISRAQSHACRRKRGATSCARESRRASST